MLCFFLMVKYLVKGLFSLLSVTINGIVTHAIKEIGRALDAAIEKMDDPEFQENIKKLTSTTMH